MQTSTLLHLLDRLSVRSVFSGSTGSICGVIATIGLIILSIFLFTSSVILYIKGDYVEGSFNTIKKEVLELSTGCDLQLAISFRNKNTNAIADHIRLREFINFQIKYLTVAGQQFYSEVEECKGDYFNSYDLGEQKNFTSSDCFTVPNDIHYIMDINELKSSKFGFIMTPKCSNPLVCTAATAMSSKTIKEMLQFFQDYFYILYFTSQVVNEYGERQMIFNKVYSTQWQGHSSLAPTTIIYYQTEKMYLDNSILPWSNNKTILNAVWLGRTSGYELLKDNIGVSTYIQPILSQSIKFREYKKLDWLIGMIGGGFFLLYLMFYIVFNSINTTKQQIEASSSLVLTHDSTTEYNIQNVNKQTISCLWYFLPNCICMHLFPSQYKVLKATDNLLDISNLIKKQKTTIRNLRKYKSFIGFQQRRLELSAESKDAVFPTEKQQKMGLSLQEIEELKSVTSLFSNNLTIQLAIGSQESDNNIRILAMEECNKYSKDTIYEDKVHFYGKILNFIKFFDVYGAKPAFVANPGSHSVWGCLITLAIVAMSIFVFSLTFYHMNAVRTHLDKIYKSPNDINISMITGTDYKMAFCLGPAAFNNNLIIGPNRIADVKYFQYHRNGSKEQTFYYDPVWMQNQSTYYFEMSSTDYPKYLFKYCFKPQQNIELKVQGNNNTTQQSYFGVSISPYCSDTPVFCASVKNETKSKFFSMLSSNKMWVIIPENDYYPGQGKMISNAMMKYLNQIVVENSGVALEASGKSIEETIQMSGFEIIDDTQSWMVGDEPLPTVSTLTNERNKVMLSSSSKVSAEPYYRLKIGPSGDVKRILFTTYKIDLLLATIGGVFAFFYFVFGWIGIWSNRLLVRKTLAKQLYTHQQSDPFNKIQCLGHRFTHKIESDLEYLRLINNINNCHRLSSAIMGDTNLVKNVATIYLKQSIGQNQQIVINQDDPINQSQSESDGSDRNDGNDGSDGNQWDGENKIKTKSSAHSISSTKAFMKSDIEIQPEDDTPNRHGHGSKLLSNFDAFHSPSSLTFEGKRRVGSVCGGLSSIIIGIMVVIIIQHFQAIYFSSNTSTATVSTQKIIDQNHNENSGIFLNSGVDFKFMVSFFKTNDYGFHNVSSLMSEVEISVVKYRNERKNGKFIENNSSILLKPCAEDYLNGFLSEYSDRDYFYRKTWASGAMEISNAYCLPDGTNVTVHGTIADQEQQYFKLLIAPISANSSAMNMVKQLLETYIPRIHISQPIQNYNSRIPTAPLFNMVTLVKSSSYQLTMAKSYTVTLQKKIIRYDIEALTLTPAVQNLYDINIDSQIEYKGQEASPSTRYFQIKFIKEDYYIRNTVRRIKLNEMFGIIGGAILTLFFGLGCFPKSFNEYRMRYLIGSKLYAVADYSQWKTFQAWILSPWASLTGNYQFNETLKITTLIQNKTRRDLSLYEIYRNLFACESSLYNMQFMENKSVNLCRICVKQIIDLNNKIKQNQSHSQKQQQVDSAIETVNKKTYQFSSLDPYLKAASKMNRFSEWETFVLQESRNKQVDITEIFEEKWLEKYWGTGREGQRQQKRNTSIKLRKYAGRKKDMIKVASIASSDFSIQ